MNKSESIKNLAGALAKAQAEMPVVRMDAKNPFLKYKYATLGAVINACRPILAKYEFSVIQLPVNEGDRIGVDTMLLHSSGEWIADSVFIPIDEQKGLSVAQTVGVAITYVRRYGLAALLGLYADEDTDASENGNSEHGELPPVQLEKKPLPEKKVVVPATDIQTLRATYGKVFSAAQKAGHKNLPVLTGKSTATEIEAAIKKVNSLMTDALVEELETEPVEEA